MKKRSLTALLLAAVVLCGSYLLLDRNDPALLENDPAAQEELDPGEVFLEDDEVPLSGLPTDLPPAEEEDPFQDFTEEEVKMINQVFETVNKERVSAGQPELKLNPTLCKAAMVRAGECVQTFSHTRPNGTKYRTAIEEAGLQSPYTGENVATGHTSPDQVMKGWMSSAGHKENILRDRFTEIGIGMVKNTGNRYGGYSWCQLFIQ